MGRFRPQAPKTYDKQTYASPYWVVRYPHQMRYRTAIEALLAAHPTRVLDYGAGDGRLLVDAVSAGLDADLIVAYEPVEEYALQLAAKLEERAVAERVSLAASLDAIPGVAFDFIVCFGVLEHMPLGERQLFYDLVDSRLAPGGRVLIDVPVEIGLTLLVKNLGRRALKGRAQEYGWRELLRLACGGVMYDPSRFDPSDRRTWISDHRGFDYRLLRSELSHRFALLDERRTPLPWLPAALCNQEVYFTIARR